MTPHMFPTGNQCASNPCDARADCANSGNTYTCTCGGGYTGGGDSCSGMSIK